MKPPIERRARIVVINDDTDFLTLMSELLTWIRTEPTSFFLDERWEVTPEPSMPAHTTSARLKALVFDLQAAESDVKAAVDLLRSLPYGPPSAPYVFTVFMGRGRGASNARTAWNRSQCAWPF